VNNDDRDPLVAMDSVDFLRDQLPDEVRAVQQQAYWADVDALADQPVGVVVEREYRPGEFFHPGDSRAEQDAYAVTETVRVWFIDMFGEPERGLIRMREPLPGPEIVMSDPEDAAHWIVRQGRR